MGLLSSSSRPSSSNLARTRSVVPSCIPFLALLSVSLFLLYKVDIYMIQSRRGPRRYQETPYVLTPVSHNVEPRVVKNGTFDRLFEIAWGNDHAEILEEGELLMLSLDRRSGSGFRSKNEYLFGKIDMQLKLVQGNSAGTVTAYYLSSEGDFHDEIDFEFLGNTSGDPYTLHTNVYSQGKGNREQQFFLWFDPTADFHTYTVIWNPDRILFYVDSIPIRVFRNDEALGVPFPNAQPMRIHSSIWNAEEWATRGGLVKTDWSRAPFTASYRKFSADACVWSTPGGSSCLLNSTKRGWFREKLNTAAVRKLKWAQKYHRVYDYCNDSRRFPEGPAPECKFR